MIDLKRVKTAMPGWLPFALVVFASFLVGLCVLPRLDGAGAPASLESKPAPDFALPVIHGGPSGNRIRLSNLAGHVVVLDFWASWCEPCLQQIPILSRFAKAVENAAVSVIGVNTADEPEAAAQILRQLDPAYPSVRDEGSVAALYQIETLPTLVIVSPTGNVRSIRHGVHRQEDLEALVRAARER